MQPSRSPRIATTLESSLEPEKTRKGFQFYCFAGFDHLQANFPAISSQPIRDHLLESLSSLSIPDQALPPLNPIIAGKSLKSALPEKRQPKAITGRRLPDLPPANSRDPQLLHDVQSLFLIFGYNVRSSPSRTRPKKEVPLGRHILGTFPANQLRLRPLQDVRWMFHVYRKGFHPRLAVSRLCRG